MVMVACLPGGLVRADELRWEGPWPVAVVLAGDRLALADGREVRLAGIRLPGGPAAGAAAARARAGLAGLAEGRAVRLGLAAQAHDRYGRLVAQLERADGLWLQGRLLEQGLVQVQTRPGETERAPAMLGLERQARAAGRGLWADPDQAPREVEVATGTVGAFQIVRGRIERVHATDRYVYLNFGADWRRDFTLRLQPDRLGLDPADLAGLAGQEVEARGLVLDAQGGLISLSHGEQFEVLR